MTYIQQNKTPGVVRLRCVLWQALALCFLVTEQKGIVLAQPVNNFWYRIMADSNLFPHRS